MYWITGVCFPPKWCRISSINRRIHLQNPFWEGFRLWFPKLKMEVPSWRFPGILGFRGGSSHYPKNWFQIWFEMVLPWGKWCNQTKAHICQLDGPNHPTRKLGCGFIFLNVHPYLGKMIQFDEHIFQMGWFNHQLEKRKTRWGPWHGASGNYDRLGSPSRRGLWRGIRRRRDWGFTRIPYPSLPNTLWVGVCTPKPENDGLEDDSPLPGVYSQVPC